MAYVNLTNTSGQVDLALRCSYDRLIKSYSGPLTECRSTQSNSGFAIEDGNKGTGFIVANCGIILCKNKIDVKCDADLSVLLMPNRCLNLSGNGSIYSFSCDGTVSFGSGICTAYGKGIQSFQASPNLILKDTDTTNTHAIKFLNKEDFESFAICQSNTFTCIQAMGNFIFKSSGHNCSFHISGSHTSVSGIPISNYGLVNYGNSLLSGRTLFGDCVEFTGNQDIKIHNFSTSNTGLCVLRKSLFTNDVGIYSPLFVSGNITARNTISGCSGFFNINCSINCILSPCAVVQNLCVSGGASSLSGNVCVLGTTCLSGYSKLNAFTFTCGTGDKLRILGDVNTCGSLIVTGNLQICQSTNQTADHSIVGRSFQVRSTGVGCCNNFFGSVILCGDLSVTGEASFDRICSSTKTKQNIICGPLCLYCTVNSSCSISANTLCGVLGICSPGGITGNCIFACEFKQQKTDSITCFLSSGIQVGLNNCGYIKSINTAKAWGIIKMMDGVASLTCGYNLKANNPFVVYSNTSYLSNNAFAMGICFQEAIKYPFAVNFSVYSNSANPLLITAGPPHYITGSSFPESALFAAGGLGSSFSIPTQVELYVCGRNANNASLIEAYALNSAYSEIFFNFRNQKNACTLYCDLIKSYFDVIVHFNVFSFQ